jgi:hypothetical protein
MKRSLSAEHGQEAARGRTSVVTVRANAQVILRGSGSLLCIAAVLKISFGGATLDFRPSLRRAAGRTANDTQHQDMTRSELKSTLHSARSSKNEATACWKPHQTLHCDELEASTHHAQQRQQQSHNVSSPRAPGTAACIQHLHARCATMSSDRLMFPQQRILMQRNTRSDAQARQGRDRRQQNKASNSWHAKLLDKH